MAKKRKSKIKAQEKVNQLIASMSKEMINNQTIQISLFYLLVVGARKAYDQITKTPEVPGEPTPEPSAWDIFMDGYWDGLYRNLFGPLGEAIPRPDAFEFKLSEFNLLELALLAAIPLSAGGGLKGVVGDIADILT